MSTRKRKFDAIEPSPEDDSIVAPAAKKKKTSSGAIATKTSVQTPAWCTINGANGAILACGSGDMAQLGMGEGETEAMRPKPVLKLGSCNITYITAAGGANAVLVTTPKVKTELWTWGCNDHGVLGRVTKSEDEQATPGLVTALADKEIVQVSLGDYHMMCLDSQGQVWSWGSYRDANGILGFKPGIAKQTTPQLMSELKDKKIISVASGDNTSYALTETGHLFTWGDARINQRTSARGDNKLQGLLPTTIVCPKKFTAMYGGGYHVFLLANDGTLWAMGLNNHKQLGTGKDEEVAMKPKQVKLPEGLKIQMCAVGQHHSALLAEGGKVYTWGRGEYGQCGHGNRENLDVPTPVKFFDNFAKAGNKVVQISCGGHHTLAVTEKGEIYSWGFGTMSQLGLGPMKDDDDRVVPTKLNNEDERSKLFAKKAVWAAGGGQHSLFAIVPLKK